MTKNRAKPGQSQSPVNPSLRESTAEPECPEMSGKSENFDLTQRQQAVLPVMAAAPSLAEAARMSGFNERTLRRWLDDDDFRAELTRLREESAGLARCELQGLMLRGVSVLSEAMDDPDKALRLRAARYALSFAVRIGETEKLRKDLQDLEDALSLRNACHTAK